MKWRQRWLTIGGVGTLVLLATACSSGGGQGEATSSGVDSGSSSVTTQVFPAAQGAQTVQLTQSPPSGITVLAYGEATGKPDGAIIQLGVTSSEQYYGPGPPPAGPVPQAVVQQLVDALVNAGVNKDDIDSNPNASTYFGSGASALLTARVMDPSRVEGVVNAFRDAVKRLEGDDQYTIQYANVRYTVQDCAPLEARAREEALKDAAARAQAYAGAMGASLGSVTAVFEVGNPVVYSPQSAASIGCRALNEILPPGYGVSFSTGVNGPDKVTVNVTLSVTYALK